MPSSKEKSPSEDLGPLAERIDVGLIRAHHEHLSASGVEAGGARSLDLGYAWLWWGGEGADRTGRVGLLGLAGPVTGADVDEAVRVASEDAAGVRVRVAPSEWSAEILAALGDLGFDRKMKVVQWIRPTANAPEAACAYPIRAMAQGEEEAFGRIVAANYPKGTDVARLIREMGEPGKACLPAFDGDTPIATGMVTGRGDGCALGYGTTLKPYRKQGLQRAMIAARVRAAAEQGWGWATASTWGYDRSSRNLARAGFLNACEVEVWGRP